MYAAKLARKIPPDGIYYEGFAGAATVAIELGLMRPDVHIVLTDTNQDVVRALESIRDHPDETAANVVQQIKFLLTDFIGKEQRDLGLRMCRDSGDPEQWLAAIQCRYPGELFTWNWNPDIERLQSRIERLPDIFAKVAQGLKRSRIMCHTAWARQCDAAFFDPPYYGSKRIYPGAQGNSFVWSRIAKAQTSVERCKYVLVTDYDAAAHLYDGFVMSRTNRELGAWRKEDKDCYYEWQRG